MIVFFNYYLFLGQTNHEVYWDNLKSVYQMYVAFQNSSTVEYIK